VVQLLHQQRFTVQAGTHLDRWDAPQFLGRDHDPPLSKPLRTALGNSLRTMSTIPADASPAGIGSACMEGGQQC
jgi:hypothetical protein